MSVNKTGVGGIGVSADEALSTGNELFDFPEILKDYVGGYYQAIQQITSATSEGPFEFNIPADGKHYIILPLTRLSGKIQITDDAGNKLTESTSDMLGVINLLPDSLFNHVEITMNNIKVSDATSNSYGYKAFIETQLSYGSEAKKTHLAASHYRDDDAGKYGDASDENVGWKERRTPFLKGEPVDFETCVHADFFKIYRYLPNHCNVSVKFNRQGDSFCFFNKSGDKKYKIKIIDLLLTVRKVELHPEALNLNTKFFKSGKLAVLPIDRNQIKTFVLPTGLGSKVLTNVINGQLPRGIIIGLVAAKAYNGKQTENPYNFQHFNLQKISLSVNGTTVPASPYEMDYKNRYFIKPYRALFDSIGVYSDNLGNDITPKKFKGGNAFYAFDLSSDCCNGEHEHEAYLGIIDISLSFRETLNEAVEVIVYSSYNNKIFINYEGDVSTDYVV
jgi:hypothetical protein